jgi:Coenzyme PQQ synthesis protein D (PqqD)
VRVDTSKYITKSLNISCRCVNSSSYIFREDTREFFQLDDVGTVIWEQLNGKTTVSDIIAHCQREFEGDPKAISDGGLEFIATLAEERTVEFSDRPFTGVLHVA